MPSYPTRRWYMVEGDELWYYHGARDKVEIPSGDDFDETVDEDLKPLVKFFHLRRIPTTPSCSGHSPTEKHFKKVWRKLRREADLICSKGLPLVDVETDEKVLFKNPDYKLDHQSFDGFYKEKVAHARNGYLGFYVRDPDVKHHLRHILTGPSKRNYFREVGSIDNHSLFAVGVHQKDEDAQSEAWRDWTKKIKQAFLGLY